MDFLSIIPQNPLGSGLLFVLLWLLVRKVVDIVGLIVLSIIAKTIAKSGYDVEIYNKGISLVKRKSGSNRKKRD